MTNYFKYDFNEDFKFDEEIANSKKIEDINNIEKQKT